MSEQTDCTTLINLMRMVRDQCEEMTYPMTTSDHEFAACLYHVERTLASLKKVRKQIHNINDTKKGKF